MGGLFSSIVVGGVEVPNRIVMPPMTTRLADDEGYVTEALVAYYRARALGGVGLITVEMGSPERAGRHRFRELGVYDDRFLPGLERLQGGDPMEGAVEVGEHAAVGDAPEVARGRQGQHNHQKSEREGSW